MKSPKVKTNCIICQNEFITRGDWKKTCSPECSEIHARNLRKKYLKKYYQENKDKYKKYRENNKERIEKQQKEYFELHKEEVRAKWREYYYKNREKLNNRHKEYYKKNKDKINYRKKKKKELCIILSLQTHQQ